MSQTDKIQWITLEQASEISGASVAILQDTIRKYKDNRHTLNTYEDNGELYLDKTQIINLFPSSASALEKEKIPGTLFRWFDDLRRAYETSLNTMFKRVEAVKDEHRLDLAESYDQRLKELENSYQSRIDELKSAHQSQVSTLTNHLNKLEKDSLFYQQQIVTQQQTLSQLNSRYDAVIIALKDKKPQLEKDITPSTKPSALAVDETDNSDLTTKTESQAEETAQQEENATSLTPVEVVEQTKENQIKVSDVLKQAYSEREQKNYQAAVELFEQAALLGSNKAMGALGRSYFIGEGVDKNIEKAIAFLHLASEYGFEPAKAKVEQVSDKYPTEYRHGIELAKSYSIQIKINQVENLAS